MLLAEFGRMRTARWLSERKDDRGELCSGCRGSDEGARGVVPVRLPKMELDGGRLRRERGLEESTGMPVGCAAGNVVDKLAGGMGDAATELLLPSHLICFGLGAAVLVSLTCNTHDAAMRPLPA